MGVIDGFRGYWGVYHCFTFLVYPVFNRFRVFGMCFFVLTEEQGKVGVHYVPFLFEWVSRFFHNWKGLPVSLVAFGLVGV